VVIFVVVGVCQSLCQVGAELPELTGLVDAFESRALASGDRVGTCTSSATGGEEGEGGRR